MSKQTEFLDKTSLYTLQLPSRIDSISIVENFIDEQTLKKLQDRIKRTYEEDLSFELPSIALGKYLYPRVFPSLASADPSLSAAEH
jgi:hypothetical protein